MFTLNNINDIEALPVKVTYAGETTKDGWKRDRWNVAIASKAGYWSTDYFTVIGLRRNGNPKNPKVADVLYALINDASASDYNFSDWCEEYGYSDDSLKALNLYKQCLETASALRKHLGRDTVSQLRTLLQDY